MNAAAPPAKHRPAWKSPWAILAIVVLVLLCAAGFLWWWLTRPITPVTLSAPEQQVLEQKLDLLSGDPPELAIAPGEPRPAGAAGEPVYVPGSKAIVLTQRELNGLLEMNGLGDQVRIILGNDSIVTRIQTDIPEDMPVVGGKTFKARARFLLTDPDGKPALIVDDVTVWGVSLPNAWLGDVKGENLFEVISPELNDNIISRGIEDITIGSGRITIKLAE